MHRIFIVGCSRSGTTLLQTALGAHPDLVTLPETAFFQRLVARSEARLFDRQARPEALGQRIRAACRHAMRISGPDVVQSLAEIREVVNAPAIQPDRPRRPYRTAAQTFTALLDNYATHQGKRGWIEKTPSHVHFLPEIMRYVPGARVVHIVRDGLSVVASLRAAGVTYPDAHWSVMYDTLDRCVARWNRSVEHTLEFAHDAAHVVVRYEDFVAQPAAELERVCDSIGLGFDAAMLGGRDGSSGAAYRSSEPWKDKVGLEISGKHQTHAGDILSDADIEYVRERLRPIDADLPLRYPDPAQA